MDGRIPLARVVGACLAMALGGVARPAAAQVISIEPDGATVTYSGPAIYTSDGVKPLIPQISAAPRATPAEVAEAIRDSSERHAVSRPLVEAVAWQESHFNQAAVSPKGARGVMQLMPDTARRLGVDASDARGNVEGGVAYLAQMLQRFGGDLPLALAAYNAGPEAVARYGGVPPFAETQAYVRAIIGRLGTTTAGLAPSGSN